MFPLPRHNSPHCYLHFIEYTIQKAHTFTELWAQFPSEISRHYIIHRIYNAFPLQSLSCPCSSASTKSTALALKESRRHRSCQWVDKTLVSELHAFYTCCTYLSPNSGILGPQDSRRETYSTWRPIASGPRAQQNIQERHSSPPN